jgi:chromosome segregation ATPase
LPDALFIITAILLGATIVAAVEYYMQLRKARKEYEKAKNAVDDIVLSFNRQLKKEAGKLEALGYKVEASASRVGDAVERGEQLDERMSALETKVATDLEATKDISTRLADLQRRTTDLVASHEAINSKISSLEEQTSQFRSAPQVPLEGVIPLKREKAMAHLTDTELAVLEFLASEGGKTAPEIKERVKLSREHTARLMKKLYEEGYLERETEKIPFKYSIKKEMGKLLNKAEGGAT